MKYYICAEKANVMRKTEISLSKNELEYLINFTQKGNKKAREFERAYILLALNKGYKHQIIIDILNVSNATIWRIKNKYLKLGLKAALKDLERSGQPIKYTNKHEASIIAIACSQAPAGRSRWTLELLKTEARKNPELKNINRETIRLILKKTNISLG